MALCSFFESFVLCVQGFVISDWQGVDKISSPPHSNYTASVRAAIEAGIDMVMVPFNFTEFVNDLTSLVKNKVIPVTRIDDAVRRILRVKFTMGLFENPLADYSFSNELGSQVSCCFSILEPVCKVFECCLLFRHIETWQGRL